MDLTVEERRRLIESGHEKIGVRRLTEWLRGEGHEVNHKRVKRLMREMGLYAIYPGRRLSKGSEGHKKYLRELSIEHPDTGHNVHTVKSGVCVFNGGNGLV